MDLRQPEVDAVDLLVQRIQLPDEGIQSEACIFRKVLSYLVQLRDEGIDPVPTLCDDNSILGQMRPECTSCHRSLTDQKPSGSMQHQKCLILARFDRDRAHVGTGHRFTNGGRISGVVLRAPSHEGFYVTWRNETNVMADPLQLSSPVVGSCTRLDANQARG